MAPRARWLLLSDVHFKHHDLDHITRTASWIASLPSTHNISRAIICGDLLTSRTSQPTHVLAACYRFLSALADGVPRTHVLLGNHDLAYRRDYSTSALEALRIGRLSPYVSVHTDIGAHEWDGRKVLVMPFREEQADIVETVAKMAADGSASDAVGFGHLAIHRAILQKHIVSPEGDRGASVTYRGLTGPADFAALARTFTGHFHSHQIIQQPDATDPKGLQGSVTYIGSPSQLTWNDLLDTKRGVVLLDPQTLEWEHITNPHGVTFTTADISDVLEGRCDADGVADKHVMLLGDLTRVGYVTARDRLLEMEARSVRNWSPIAPTLQAVATGLGTTSLPQDPIAAADLHGQDSATNGAYSEEENEPAKDQDAAAATDDSSMTAFQQLNLVDLVDEYVGQLELDHELDKRRDDLIRIGRRLIKTSLVDTENWPGTELPRYKDMLDPSGAFESSLSSDGGDAAASRRVFVAQPVSISVTNFLGVRDTVTLDFERQLGRGLTFIVGDNGSGKSTIIEAIVWCLFGRCIRSGLAVGDVINDIAGQDCCVKLVFANGYTVTRYRKHKRFGNRVIVERDGNAMPELERPDSKSTQAAIEELLGTDYETFVRTVVLGHESATSFLSSTPIQRRELIESLLGLETMNGHAQMAGAMTKQIGDDVAEARSGLDGLAHTIHHLRRRTENLRTTRDGLVKTQGTLQRRLVTARQTMEEEMERRRRERERLLASDPNREDSKIAEALSALQPKIDEAQSELDRLNRLSRKARLSVAVTDMQDMLKSQTGLMTNQIKSLHVAIDNLKSHKPVDIGAGVIDRSSATVRQVIGWLVGRVPSVPNDVRATYTANAQKLGAVADDLEGLHLDTSSFRVKVIQHGEKIRGLEKQAVAVKATLDGINHRLANVVGDVANRSDCDVEDVIEATSLLTAEEARAIPSKLSSAIAALASLRTQHSGLERDRARCAQLAEQRRILSQTWLDNESEAHVRFRLVLESLRSELAGAEQGAANYTKMLEEEEVALKKMQAEKTSIEERIEHMQNESALFAFWGNAFSRRAVSATTASTFRGFVLKKCLDDVNSLFAQIMTVLYEDTRHARSMTTGILKSLFASDDVAPSVLDHSARVSTAMGYAKRSGGERKRIDLALFFALVQLGQARSAHRSRYIFVDEVFDSLDEAGQRAVVRWCGWMGGRLGWVLVVTHSKILAELGERGGGEGESGRVVRVRMGEGGTELDFGG